MRNLLTITLLGLITFATGACTRVAPYQRGRLAAPRMQLEQNARQAQMQEHVHEYREGAAGSFGGKGGGCGCN